MSSDAELSEDYDNTHRAFLQALVARQTITYANAKPLLAAIQTAHNTDRPALPDDVSQEDFDNYVHALNSAISPFDLEIRSTRHQKSKETVYALVNTTSDALTQMSTTHTADEIAFVKRVLDAMFETNNTPRAEIMAITSMQALKLAKPSSSDSQRRDSGNQQTQTANAAAGLTMSHAERVLDSLVAEGWFELSRRGYYTLSPRALMELRGWLIDTYNSERSKQSQDEDEDDDEDEEEDMHQKIKFCAACREIVTIGQRCPSTACPARVHDHCIRTLFRAQGGTEKCPVCKTGWVDPLPVGEKAAREGARRTTNQRSAGGRVSNTLRADDSIDGSGSDSIAEDE